MSTSLNIGIGIVVVFIEFLQAVAPEMMNNFFAKKKLKMDELRRMKIISRAGQSARSIFSVTPIMATSPGHFFKYSSHFSNASTSIVSFLCVAEGENSRMQSGDGISFANKGMGLKRQIETSSAVMPEPTKKQASSRSVTGARIGEVCPGSLASAEIVPFEAVQKEDMAQPMGGVDTASNTNERFCSKVSLLHGWSSKLVINPPE